MDGAFVFAPSVWSPKWKINESQSVTGSGVNNWQELTAHIIVLGGGIGGVSVAHEPKQAVGNEDRTTLVSNKPFFQFTPFDPRVAVKWRSNAILITGASPAGIEAAMWNSKQRFDCYVAHSTSATGQSRRIERASATSALPPIPDEHWPSIPIKFNPAARNVRTRIIKRVSPRAHIPIAPVLESLATRH